MSKRTHGGPTLVHSKRQRTSFDNAVLEAFSHKRKRASVYLPQKRPNVAELTFIENKKESRKRPASFDLELEHLEKRMRATVPTAEEAIAFLIPHMVKLRNLYNASQQKAEDLALCVRRLENKNKELHNSVQKISTFAYAENTRLKSELELAKYRLEMFGPKPSNVYGI